MNLPECPIFYPSASEFSNFETYVEKIERESEGKGMVKIIPPATWKARISGYQKISSTVTHPVKQIVSGLAGIYQVILVSEPSMSYKNYKAYAKKRELNPKLTIEEIERLFWKTIRYDNPIYGADSSTNTLFDQDTEWNLSNLQSVLADGLKPVTLKGINSSFLYFGAWKSMFCWHKEDLDLYSINYLHFGKPKLWYCIPESDSEKFERLCKFHFPEEFNRCNQFLRHKSTQISPTILKSNGIKMHKAVQNPGEFMIIFSKCYHMGFNTGFNCAEAVNFALEKWIPVGLSVKRCECDPECAQIDMNSFLENLNKTRKYHKQETPHKRRKIVE